MFIINFHYIWLIKAASLNAAAPILMKNYALINEL